VFRFPTRILVDVGARKRFLAVVFLAASSAIAVVVPEWPPSVTARPVQGELLPYERDYLAQLPPVEAERQREEILRPPRSITEGDIDRWRRERSEMLPRVVLAAIVAVPVGTLLLIFSVVWVIVGELLTGYYLTV